LPLGNQMHGWDIEAMKAACVKDQFGLDKKLQKPWTYVREMMPAG
jgi:hypothetical protein